jgi:hypothetical protein
MALVAEARWRAVRPIGKPPVIEEIYPLNCKIDEADGSYWGETNEEAWRRYEIMQLCQIGWSGFRRGLSILTSAASSRVRGERNIMLWTSICSWRPFR